MLGDLQALIEKPKRIEDRKLGLGFDNSIAV